MYNLKEFLKLYHPNLATRMNAIAGQLELELSWPDFLD